MNAIADELAELRRSGPYRIGVIALRFMMLGPVVVVAIVSAVVLGAPTMVIKALVLLLVVVMVGSIALMWVGVIPLTAKTTRFVRASRSGLDVRRGTTLVRQLVRDAAGWKVW